MASKEEILKNNDVEIDMWPYTRNLIYKSMDEYAKQEAVAFMKAYWFGEIIFDKEPDTVEKLYEIFKPK